MANIFLKINIVLLAFVVGAVHSIHDPAYTGIKTKTYRRDPQIAQALQYQQQNQQQQQQQHFTANNYQHAANYQRPTKTINGEDTERLSAANDNYNKAQQQPNHQHYHREQPIYERNFHERHAAIASTPISSSNWDDAENVITDVYSGCPAQFTGQLPYAYDCRRFLNCWNGRGHIQSCAPGTVFNPDTLECDRPDKVVCGAVGSVKAPQNRPSNTNYRAGRLLDAKVEHVPQLCPAGVAGLHPHPTDCTKFLNCANGNVHIQDCGAGTAYSIPMMVCDFIHKVDCSGRENGDIGAGKELRTTYVNNQLSSGNKGVSHTEYGSEIMDMLGGESGNTNVPNESNESDGIFCPTGVSGHFPYPFDYSKFMHCNHGNTAIQNCVPDTMFSISKRFCDASDEIDPRDHVRNTIRDKNFEYSRTVVSCPPGIYGDHIYPYDCTKYVSCMQNQQITILSCAPGMVYSHSRSQCLPESLVQAQDRVDYPTDLRRDLNKPTASATHGATPYGGNTIVVNCPASGTGIYPYPFDCGKYLRCQNGQITVELCDPGRVFSLSTKRCDLKESVDASERVAFSQNDDYLGRELPKKNINSAENLVCPPDMNGLFLHPFDCSAYLRCSDGTRSVEYCPTGTIFSISRQQCIARDQVKTFDRVDYFEEVYKPLLHESNNTLWQHSSTSDRNEYARGKDLAFKEVDNVVCPPGAIGVFPHPLDCKKFLNCAEGITNIRSCDPGQAFDIAMEVCIPKDQVDCVTRSSNNRYGSTADFSIMNVIKPWQYSYNEAIECLPGLTGLFAHPFDCTKYLNCRNGRTIIQNCIAGSVFSITKKYCELKEHVQPNDRVPFVHEYGHELMDETEAGNFQHTLHNANHISCPAGATGMHLHPFDFNKYLKCDGDRTFTYSCLPGMVFELASKQCVSQDPADVSFVSTLESNPEWGDFNGPTQLSSNQNPRVHCPLGASGMLPHPSDCTKFLNCANGVTHIQDCAPGTAWSSDLEMCDFEDKVDCASRQTPQSEDFVRTGNLPSTRVQCPESSSGVQPHPYDCTKFLNCANGITHIQNCGPGTAWNKAMEVCDFISNVDCARQNNTNTTYFPTSIPQKLPNAGTTNNNSGSKQFQPNPWNAPTTYPNSRTYQPRPPTAQTTHNRENSYQPRPPYRPTPSTSHQQPQHFNGYGHGSYGVDSTTPRTDLFNSQPSYNDRWTGMQRPRPGAPDSDAPQSNYYPGINDNGQQPINTNWESGNVPNRRPYGTMPSSWSGTGSSVHQQHPSQTVLYAEGSLQPNRNYTPNVRKYSTPLAPFAPTTSTTPIPSTNIYYAQPVGSQEDSREIFDNISIGDLDPNKPPYPTYLNPSRSNIWTPTAQGQPSYDSLPIPNLNRKPPQSTTPHLNSQQQPISSHSDSRNSVPQTINVPVTRLFPPHSTDSRQFPETEPRTFEHNDTVIVLDNLPGTIWPLNISNDRKTPLFTSSSGRTPDVVDESNLYGGLQPPRSTPTQALATPTTYLSPPTHPTPSVRKNQQPNIPETQAHVYQIYPSIRNATVQSFSRNPHYSRSYSGVAHSRNTSWPNVGIKSPQPSVDDYSIHAQTNPESNRDSSIGQTPRNYNRQYYNPSQLTQHNDETDPDDSMQQLPISDALRMLLRPYFNRSGTVDDNEAALAESHIMNLAAAASIPNTSTNTDTTTTSTTIRPRSHISDHEDDVELIFTGEQHSLVAVPKNNATTMNSSEFHTSTHMHPRYPLNHTKKENSPESERTTNWHSHDFHQRHPYLPSPLIPDERSSSDSSQNNKWPQNRHHHHSHSRNFHMSHPNIPNPFETTTSQTIPRNTETTTPRIVHADIDLRMDTADGECPFDCGDGKCVKDFEVCDGVNNCGNRRDEAQCEHLGYEIRLRGGESTNMGRVEVKILGKWGYVCDDKFGLLDADVVCKELGFKLGASEVRGNSFYPPTNSNFSFVMDEVDCSGNETSLRQCVFKGWGVNNCGPDEVVGVVCKVPQLKCPNNYWLCSTSKECIPPAFVCDNTPDCKDLSDESERVCNSPIEYRLEGGRSSNVGRVEVMYRGEWGTVCDDDFGLNEAQVLCNSLGFFGTPKIEKNIFGPGSGPIWLDQVSCFGNETSIDKCNHWTWGEHNCNHTEDVGLRCTAGPAPRRTTSKSGTKGGATNAETQRSLEDSSSSLENIGLYGSQVQRSSKFLDTNNQKRCGQFKENLIDEYEHPEERVVNGTMAKRGQHPWQATIRTKGRGGISSHWCGAVLISKKHLLTAAHCLVGYPKGAYFIRMGDHYANIAEASEIDSYIENWYIHEKFRDKTHMNNDIALIVLKNPVRFNDYIQPICLPDKNAPLQVNRMCTISGWGSIKSGVSTPSNILRAAQLPILSDETCKQAHVYGTSMTEGMFCAGSMDESVDACDGDSGGPLVCSDEDGETLYGIISWGQQCGFANKPGVYVRIEKYIDWIYEKINFSMQQTSN